MAQDYVLDAAIVRARQSLFDANALDLAPLVARTGVTGKRTPLTNWLMQDVRRLDWTWLRLKLHVDTH